MTLRRSKDKLAAVVFLVSRNRIYRSIDRIYSAGLYMCTLRLQPDASKLKNEFNCLDSQKETSAM